MYIEIKDDNILSWCRESYSDFVEVDIDYSTFDPDKYEVKDGKLVDISNTEGYRSKVALKEKNIREAEILSQIEELDKKRIRAIAEPQLKDETSGQTWLEYYTLQIQTLRFQLESM